MSFIEAIIDTAVQFVENPERDQKIAQYTSTTRLLISYV